MIYFAHIELLIVLSLVSPMKISVQNKTGYGNRLLHLMRMHSVSE